MCPPCLSHTVPARADGHCNLDLTKRGCPYSQESQESENIYIARYNKHVPLTIVEQFRVSTQLGGIAGVLATQRLLVRIQTNRGVREIQT